MTQNNITVAVTGINNLAHNPGPGTAVAKCLKASTLFNINVIGLGYDALDPGFYLPEYIDEGYLIPYPSAGESALIDRISEIHKNTAIDIIIPCLDSEISSFIRISHLLDELGISSYLPTSEQIRLRNKDHLTELAEYAKISCPKIKAISDLRFFETCEEDDWQYPMVVKGVFYDAKIVYNKMEAEKAFKSISRQWGYPVLVQKFVSGEEYNLTGIGDGNGYLINPVMMKKLAITDKGKAWAGISYFDNNLLMAAQSLVNAISWKGPLEVEVMKDDKGNYQLIEINPRFPAWIYLSVGVNKNLPENLIQLSLNQHIIDKEAAIAGKIFVRYAEEKIIDISKFESIVMQGNK